MDRHAHETKQIDKTEVVVIGIVLFIKYIMLSIMVYTYIIKHVFKTNYFLYNHVTHGLRRVGLQASRPFIVWPNPFCANYIEKCSLD